MEISRLFDLLAQHAAKSPTSYFVSGKENQAGNKIWKHYTFEEVAQLTNRVSQFLLNLGLQPDDKIAIIANNRPEWNFVDLGALQVGAVVVPMYPNISAADYAFIFQDAGIKYAFVSDAEVYSKVQPLLGKLPAFKAIYTFDEIAVLPGFWKELPPEADLSLIASRKAKVKPDDVSTIIYTSGTTGTPKGVMLTHRNILSNILSINQVVTFQEHKRALSFLPLCHSFERMVFYAYLSYGLHIHYAESLETIPQDLLEVKPFCFTTVPRLLEKVYEKIMAKAATLSGIQKQIFFWAVGVAEQYQLGKSSSGWYAAKLAIARLLVFSKWREALGNEVEFIITGAAAMQPRLITLFMAAGINVIEGYGLTETSPVLCANRLLETERCIGTVGMPVPGVEIRLAEDGEILAKGQNIMKGYYNRPDLTAEVIDEQGWFHTGDIGQWIQANGNTFLKITDRKKELFKTAGGKYIAPQVIENKLKESTYIEQIMVVGGDDKKFVSALIIPSFEQVVNWGKTRGMLFENRDNLMENPQVMKLIMQEVHRFNPNFGHWEQVKKVTLLPQEWTIATGELTPTLKPKRKFIAEKFAKEIEEMYGG